MVNYTPFNADRSEVDDTGQRSEHLDVADDLTDRGGLESSNIKYSFLWRSLALLFSVITWYTEESTCLQMSRGR